MQRGEVDLSAIPEEQGDRLAADDDEPILTSQRLDFLVKPSRPVSPKTILIHHIRPVDLENAVPEAEAVRRVLEFIGPRPVLGYYLQFDLGMLDKYARPLMGVGMPNRRIEVSRLYYDWRAPQAPRTSSIVQSPTWSRTSGGTPAGVARQPCSIRSAPRRTRRVWVSSHRGAIS